MKRSSRIQDLNIQNCQFSDQINPGKELSKACVTAFQYHVYVIIQRWMRRLSVSKEGRSFISDEVVPLSSDGAITVKFEHD